MVQCENLTAASWHAVESGTPLNRFITINWSSAGVANTRAATSGFLKLAGDWLSDRGFRRAYIWVRENNGGDHVHILIHVPHSLAHAFSRRQRGWLKALGAEPRQGVIMTEPIARDYSTAETSPTYYQHNLAYVIRYLLKGADEKAAPFTDHRRKFTGLVFGQRAGVSHDLGRRAGEIRALGHSPNLASAQAHAWKGRPAGLLPNVKSRSRCIALRRPLSGRHLAGRNRPQ